MEDPVLNLLRFSISVDRGEYEQATNEDERVNFGKRIAHQASLIEKYNHDVPFDKQDTAMMHSLCNQWIHQVIKV